MRLVIDGHGCDRARLPTPKVTRRFLDEFPSRIRMTKIVPPAVYTYHGPTPEDWGVSGFVIIAESRISAHAFPDRRCVNIDVFSCKGSTPTRQRRSSPTHAPRPARVGGNPCGASAPTPLSLWRPLHNPSSLQRRRESMRREAPLLSYPRATPCPRRRESMRRERAYPPLPLGEGPGVRVRPALESATPQRRTPRSISPPRR